MLKISQKQLDDFRSAQLSRFHRELMTLLRNEIPNEVARYDDAALLEQIAIGHEKAGEFGIESDRGVSRFIALRLISAPPFDEHPQVRAYLQRKDIEPTKKMDLIFKDLIAFMERDLPGATK